MMRVVTISLAAFRAHQYNHPTRPTENRLLTTVLPWPLLGEHEGEIRPCTSISASPLIRFCTIASKSGSGSRHGGKIGVFCSWPESGWAEGLLSSATLEGRRSKGFKPDLCCAACEEDLDRVGFTEGNLTLATRRKSSMAFEIRKRLPYASIPISVLR